MYNLHLFYACYFTLFYTISSYQVLDDNADTFRNLAKRFVPQNLADQLASLMTQATDRHNYNDNEYYDNNNNNDRDGDNDNEYVGQDEDQQDNNANAYRQNKKPRTMKVNLDELVEKVKDRILADFRTTIPQQRAIPFRQELEDEELTGGSLAKSFKKSSPIKRPVNRPFQLKKKPQPSQPAAEIVENHDLYEKVKLSKVRGQKDSYEDYVTPKKEYDIFESEEKGNKKRVGKQGYKESDYQTNLKNIQHQDKITTRRWITLDSTLDDNYRTVKQFHSLNKQTRANYEEYDRNTNKKNINYDGYNKNRDDFDSSNTKNKNNDDNNKVNVRTTQVEYVDDDYHTMASTIDREPKAMTEFIGGDYKDEPLPSTQRTKNGYKNTRKVSKKIVTNMPTRERFKMSTPNYYEKLPRIAEKYDFDEPIPERDRVAENLRPIGNPAGAINGRIRV